MANINPAERELLKTVLEPLLEDFQFWFTRAKKLLESENITFLSDQEQNSLLERVNQAQKEVNAAQLLFKATNGTVGIDTPTLVPWHQLVGECWQVSLRWRSIKADSANN
ncbi:MAG: DUF2605 domain-containing protein [Microcystaceae cyanobacterium]